MAVTNIKNHLETTYQDVNASKLNKKFVELVKNDPDTKNIKFKNNADLMLLVNYINIRDKGYPDYEVRLKQSPYLQIVYVPTKEKQMKDNRFSSIKLFGEDSRDLDASLKGFYTNNESRKKALKYAKNIISEKTNIGLYLYSKDFQVGKTYLANAIANKFADHGKTGVFLFAPSFVRKFKDFGNNEERIRIINNSDILVIDDLGAENNSDWFKREIMLPILQHRLAHSKLTIITSNYSRIELLEHYRRKSQLEDLEIKRLGSRIFELTKEVMIDE